MSREAGQISPDAIMPRYRAVAIEDGGRDLVFIRGRRERADLRGRGHGRGRKNGDISALPVHLHRDAIRGIDGTRAAANAVATTDDIPREILHRRRQTRAVDDVKTSGINAKFRCASAFIRAAASGMGPISSAASAASINRSV